MKYLSFILVVVFCFSVGAFAQEKLEVKKSEAKAAMKAEAKEVMLHGYIVDAMCAKGMAKNSDTVMKKAAAHTKGCALEEACASSGFGVFADGKWYKFDEAGDKQALELITNSKTEKGFMAMVSGQPHGDKFAVTTITEHKMKMEEKKDMQKEKKSEEHQH